MTILIRCSVHILIRCSVYSQDSCARYDAFKLPKLFDVICDAYTPHPDVIHLKEIYDFKRYIADGGEGNVMLRIDSVTLRSATTEQSGFAQRKQKINKEKDDTDVNVENPTIVGKTTVAHKLLNTL